MTVAGVDFGPSTKNESTGVLIARRLDERWQIESCRTHRCASGDQQQCDELLVEAIHEASIVVIDAPLALGSIKEWERALRRCESLPDSMKPSPSGNLAGHMWRAAALRRLLPPEMLTIEIFPAMWFGLCEFDADATWKGQGDRAMGERKRQWFDARVSAMARLGIVVEPPASRLSPDECDALPCVLCGILAAEGRTLSRLDETDPPVLFPPEELWDRDRLAAAIIALPWRRWRHEGISR